MKKQMVVRVAAFGLVTAAYLSLPAASVAQAPKTLAPKAETLEQKVIRLEKEVRELREDVARLKSQRPTVTLTPNYLQQPPSQLAPSQRPDGTPFNFNGKTYYRMELHGNGGANGTNAISIARPTATIRFAAPAQ